MTDLGPNNPNHGPFGPPPTGPPLVGQPAPPVPPAGPVQGSPPSVPSGPPSTSPRVGPPGQFTPGVAPVVPQPGVQPGVYPASVGAVDRSDRRPWWGMGDIVLGLPFIIMLAIAGTLFGLVFTSIAQLESFADGTSGELPLALLATGLIGQQFGQGVWPLIVSKWKGLGSTIDWRLRFDAADLWIGPLTGFSMLIVAGLAGLGITELVNLEDEAAADNTAFLTDAEGTPWLYVFIFAVVIGAPVAEEIFFRGLCLRAIEKRFGLVVGVVASTVIFTLPHFIGGGLKGTIVLFTVIGLVGAILGVLVAKTDRLGGAIIAHMVFNCVGVLGALGVISEPEESMSALIRVVSGF